MTAASADVWFVVRHAKAGSRRDWDGDDRLRPLSKAGWQQATAIADRLAAERVSGLYASPYVRCVQTLEPLAERLGTAVVPDERLAEGAAFADALTLLREAGPRAVMCSHGDVIPELMSALVRRGATLTSEPDWRKGALWVLTAGDEGIARVTAEPPPGR